MSSLGNPIPPIFVLLISQLGWMERSGLGEKQMSFVGLSPRP